MNLEKSSGLNGQLDRDAFVEDLVDVKLKQWRGYLIFSCFNDYEAENIMNISLSFRIPKDKMLWFPEKNGCYFVKSSYHFIGVEKSWLIVEA